MASSPKNNLILRRQLNGKGAVACLRRRQLSIFREPNHRSHFSRVLFPPFDAALELKKRPVEGFSAGKSDPLIADGAASLRVSLPHDTH